MANKISVFFIYSYWIYVISILYFFNLFPYSPLFSNLLMVTVLPAILIFNNTLPVMHKLFALILEISFLVLVLIKGVQMDYVFNYLLLMTYLIVLAVNNKSICDIYCRELPSTMKKISRKFKSRFCIMDLFNAFSLCFVFKY